MTRSPRSTALAPSSEPMHDLPPTVVPGSALPFGPATAFSSAPAAAADPAQPPLRIEHLALDALTPWATNARTHSKEQVRLLANSIQAFGFTNPVLVDGAGTILDAKSRRTRRGATRPQEAQP